MVHARHELILGGQKSGKSRCAEQRAADWLAAAPGHEAWLLATAWPADEEMAARIARHRADRAARVPGLHTLDAVRDLPAAIEAQAAPRRLLVVDCLTLWLTQELMPPAALREEPPLEPAAWGLRVEGLGDALCAALARAEGPVVLVSNEIGHGVVPLGAETRAFVDALGRLHQRVAAACARVTLMVAGIDVPVKRP